MRWSVNLIEKPKSYGLEDIYNTVKAYLNEKIEKLLFCHLYISSYIDGKLKPAIVFTKTKKRDGSDKDIIESKVISHIINIFEKYGFKFSDIKYSTAHEFSLSESYEIAFEKEITLEEFSKNILHLDKVKELLSNNIVEFDNITDYVSHFIDEKNNRRCVFSVSKDLNYGTFKVYSQECYYNGNKYKCKGVIEITFENKNGKLGFDIGYSNSKDFVSIYHYPEKESFVKIWYYLRYGNPKEEIIKEEQAVKSIMEEVNILKSTIIEFPKGNLNLHKTIKNCKTIKKFIEDLTSF